jgi:hypothetical protein
MVSRCHDVEFLKHDSKHVCEWALISTTNTTEIPDHGNGVFTIGQDACCGSSNLNGTIDEVRVYNRLLSAQEIRDLYDSTSN